MLMDMPSKEFALAGTLEELKIKGRLVVHGGHRPILVVYDRGRVFALDNRCPHMGFPLETGSVEDGILTCHWHHARFDLESGCTFDLWADDVPICPVEVRNGDVWVKTTFIHADPAAHWHQRLALAILVAMSTRFSMVIWRGNCNRSSTGRIRPTANWAFCTSSSPSSISRTSAGCNATIR
jgi:nitrite reductase/ring-hydroxylating ferredoxin subunit